MTDPQSSYDRDVHQAREFEPERPQVVDVELTDDEYTLSVRDAQGNVVDAVSGLLPSGIPAAEFLRQQGVQVSEGTWEFAHLTRGAEAVGGWRASGTAANWDAVAERVGQRRGAGAAVTVDVPEMAAGRGPGVERGGQAITDGERTVSVSERTTDEAAVRSASSLRAAAEQDMAIEQTARAEVNFDHEMATDAHAADDQTWAAEQAHDGNRATAAQGRRADHLAQAEAAQDRAATSTTRQVTVRASSRWIPNTPPGHEPARGRSQSRGR